MTYSKWNGTNTVGRVTIRTGEEHMTTTLTSTIREWVAAGCDPTTLYQDEDGSYYTSAHPSGLGGYRVTELTDDAWGETPTTQGDADWIARQVIGRREEPND